MVICVDSRKDKVENLALPATAITTLQQSAKFKNLFDQSHNKRKENSHRGFGKYRLQGKGGVPVSRNARRLSPPIGINKNHVQ